MPVIGLVACVGTKRADPAEARDLYESSLFVKSRVYVEQRCTAWYILSAKYGLVRPTDVIAPYDETLNTKRSAERREWADRVWAKLAPVLKKGDQVVLLAGQRYRENIIERLRELGCAVDVPMSGLGIGRQLQWLTRNLRKVRVGVA